MLGQNIESFPVIRNDHKMTNRTEIILVVLMQENVTASSSLNHLEAKVCAEHWNNKDT